VPEVTGTPYIVAALGAILMKDQFNTPPAELYYESKRVALVDAKLERFTSDDSGLVLVVENLPTPFSKNRTIQTIIT
jgi:hypothetical protein